MNIRPAGQKDLSEIQRLNQQIFDYEIAQCAPPGWNANHPYEKEGIEYFTKAIENDDGYAGFVYEKDDQIVAYVILRQIPDKELPHRNDIKLIQLHTFCVTNDYRGQGIGQEMVAFAKEWAQEKGATHLKVVAMAGNALARSVYQKCGFEEFEVTYEMAVTE